MRSAGYALAVVLLGLAAAPLAGQEPDSAASPARPGAVELTLGGRVQTQFNTTSADGEPPAQWILRRVRLDVRVRLADRVDARIHPDFGVERATIKDAYVTLDAGPALRVLVGRAHRPFGALTRYSSLTMPPVEKSADIRGVTAWEAGNLVADLGYADRDVGVQLTGTAERWHLRPEYALALVQGPLGDGFAGEATYQVVARAGIAPASGVEVGLSWSRRDFAGPDGGSDGDALRGGQALALDLAVEPVSGGPRLLAEVTGGDFDPWTGATFRGAQAWLAYGLETRSRSVTLVEPVLRVSHGDLEGPGTSGGGTLVTPGLNVYVGRLNRVMVNYDRWLPAEGDAEGSYKVMFQAAF